MKERSRQNYPGRSATLYLEVYFEFWPHNSFIFVHQVPGTVELAGSIGYLRIMRIFFVRPPRKLNWLDRLI